MVTLIPTDPTTLTVNAERIILLTGSTPNQYTALQDLRFHLERPEFKEIVTGISNTPIQTAVYFYGAADNWVEFTILMSETEYATFAVTNFARQTGGTLPIVYYALQITDESGNVEYIGNSANTPKGFKAVTVWSDVSKPVVGGIKVRLRLRLLEDTISISSTYP